jgi:hypothetical protein
MLAELWFVRMIDDAVVNVVCILNFKILTSPTILTLGDEVQCRFIGVERSAYRIDKLSAWI